MHTPSDGGVNENPYAPPQTGHRQPRDLPPRVNSFPFRDPTILGRWCMGLLGVFLSAMLLSIPSRLMYRDLVEQNQSAMNADFKSLDFYTNIIVCMNSCAAISLVTGLILFLIWLYRVYANLGAIGGRSLRFRPSWVVLWQFVPYLNLYFGFHALKEILGASNPDVGLTTRDTRSEAPRPDVLYVFTGVQVANLVLRIFAERNRAVPVSQGIGGFSTLQIVLSLTFMGGFLFTILIVRRITRDQVTKAQRIRAGSLIIEGSHPSDPTAIGGNTTRLAVGVLDLDGVPTNTSKLTALLDGHVTATQLIPAPEPSARVGHEVEHPDGAGRSLTGGERSPSP
jgi:hypothetical protein